MPLVGRRDGALCLAGDVLLVVGRRRRLPELVVVARCEVNLVCVGQLLVVVGVERQQFVGHLLRPIGVVASAGGVVLVGFRRDLHLALALGVVVSERQVQLELRQRVQLVLRVEVAHESAYGAVVVGLVEQPDGVHRGPRDWQARSVDGLVVAPVVWRVGGVVVPRDGNRGVPRRRVPDGCRVGEVVLVDAELGPEVQLEVVVQQRRRDAQVAADALSLVGVQDSVLEVVSERGADRDVGRSRREADVVVRPVGQAEDLVVPVGVGVAQQGNLRFGPVLLDDVAKLRRGEHVGEACRMLQRVCRRQPDVEPPFLAFLRRDDDDAVRSAAAIYGCRGSVLENRHALDVGGVDQREEVAAVARDATILQGDSVQDDQRVVAGVE